MTNDQLTEDQRTEAWRHLHASHLERQTAAVESIRSNVVYLLTIAVVVLVLGVVGVLAGITNL